ncbi:MAG TPA: glycosyltransferase family 2 protein [Vicinamibacterales bacterium]
MAAAGSVTIVVPAFNEGESIGAVVAELKAAAGWHEVLVIDDGSTDGTGKAAQDAGARVVRHPYNKGNGASVKTAIREARSEFIAIVDGDGQHRPEDTARLIAPLGEYDLVVGARDPRTQATAGRRAGNAVLNWLASYLTERHIPDLTSGFRAARREYLLEFIHLLPNGFSTPPTTPLAFLKAGYNVTFEPIAARARVGTSKIRLASDGAKFLLILLKVITIFSPLRIFAPVSALSFALGAAYGAWNFVYHARIPNGAVLLLMFSIMILLVGLVSEQIATLRFEGRRSVS